MSLALSIFNGAKVEQVLDVVEKAYRQIYSGYSWQRMVVLLELLHSLGVKNYLITASSSIFVDEIRKYLPIYGIIGVDVAIYQDRLTNGITQLPYNLGKRQIVEKIP